MSVMSVEIDLPSFIRSMENIPIVLTKAIRAGIKYQLTELQILARKKHRHKTRSGTLNSSIQWNMINNFEGEVGFEPGINRAEYGKYVHEGHGSWQPDQFLYEALEARRPIIQAEMEQAIERGLVQAGLK